MKITIKPTNMSSHDFGDKLQDSLIDEGIKAKLIQPQVATKSINPVEILIEGALVHVAGKFIYDPLWEKLKKVWQKSLTESKDLLSINISFKIDQCELIIKNMPEWYKDDLVNFFENVENILSLITSNSLLESIDEIKFVNFGTEAKVLCMRKGKPIYVIKDNIVGNPNSNDQLFGDSDDLDDAAKQERFLNLVKLQSKLYQIAVKKMRDSDKN